MKNTMLMIMDGFGLNGAHEGNAIAAAKTPNLDRLFAEYPMTTLGASGLDVGLPDGQMGNSEVGHTNIGAGRIVYQELTKITKKINDGLFFENEALKGAMKNASENDSSLHIMGLLSDGGVHSHITHLFALIDMAKANGLKKVYVHCFLDGRDVPPACAGKYIDELEAYMAETGTGEIASVSGRFYAMDRDNRFERLVLAYDALTLGEGREAASSGDVIRIAYDAGETDEFVIPTVVKSGGGDPHVIGDKDSVIMYNFRPDRAREITRALVDDDFTGFERKKLPADLFYVCMTQYDASMPGVHVAYPPEDLENTIGKYVSDKGSSQLRIAETEKYAHVTFFFNGGVEEPFKGEDRILIPSPKVATYDLKPEMSAFEVTDALIEAMEKNEYDLVIINYANCDMVGHTGVFDAAVKAVETVDACVGRVAEYLLSKGGQLLLTADHGNADVMVDGGGNVVTAHSLNRVPLCLISEEGKDLKLKEGGVLADIAPTLLTLMGLAIPSEMEGTCLFEA